MGPVTVGRLGAEDVGARIRVAEPDEVARQSENPGSGPSWIAGGELVQVRHELECTVLTLNVAGGFLELRMSPNQQVTIFRPAPPRRGDTS